MILKDRKNSAPEASRAGFVRMRIALDIFPEATTGFEPVMRVLQTLGRFGCHKPP